MTREDYEERREAKIDKFRGRVQTAREKSQILNDAASSMASVIPFGQPILVGHHSEKRDRKYREQIQNKFAQARAESGKADYYEQRVRSVEQNHAISSDDPDAVKKLETKIVNCEKMQAVWKAINKIVLSKKRNYTIEQKKDDLRGLNLDGEYIELSESTIHKFFEEGSDRCVGVPSYRLTKNNANIRRMKQRVEGLKSMQTEPDQVDQEKTFETSEGEVRVQYNTYENRVQLRFPGKPSSDVRDTLKSNGFRWSPREVAWQRQLNISGKYAAKRVLEVIADISEFIDMNTYDLI